MYDLLKELREERKSYSEMIDFCCNSLILNNSIVQELEKNGYYFETFCGDYCYYLDGEGNYISYDEYERLIDEGGEASEEFFDIYQYFIIDYRDAERLERFTNELVLYNEELELYILCVTHFGTPWEGVPSNWKEVEEWKPSKI